jgi:hypothetical protein
MMGICREKYRYLPVRINSTLLNHLFKSIPVYLLFSLVVLFSRVSAQVTPDSKILFLHLKIKNNNVELIDYTIKPGVIKQKRSIPEEEQEFYYEAKSKTNTVLYKESMNNPLNKRMEYEDEKNPGQIKQKIIKSDTADFVLRIPFKENLSEVAFFMKEQIVSVKGERRVLTKSINKIVLDFKKDPR